MEFQFHFLKIMIFIYWGLTIPNILQNLIHLNLNNHLQILHLLFFPRLLRLKVQHCVFMFIFHKKIHINNLQLFQKHRLNKFPIQKQHLTFGFLVVLFLIQMTIFQLNLLFLFHGTITFYFYIFYIIYIIIIIIFDLFCKLILSLFLNYFFYY